MFIAARITWEKFGDENFGNVLIFIESIHHPYSVIQTLETLDDLEIIISNLIGSTENMDLLVGLKIIKNSNITQ